MSTSTTQPAARVSRPGDGDRQPAASIAEPVNGVCCFRPPDEPTNSVSPCFHPGDGDEPQASHVEPGNGVCCFRPPDEPSASVPPGFASDLATDLHLALTSLDERELALLAGSRT